MRASCSELCDGIPGTAGGFEAAADHLVLAVNMAAKEAQFQVRTQEQLRAVSNLTRHCILDVLRQGEATTSQVATRLGIAKGSASYHLRVLERAGFIEIVRTQPVRGVVEKYYAPAVERIELPPQ